MRAAFLALVLNLCLPFAAHSFQTEEEKYFPAEGSASRVLSILSTTDTSVLAPVIADFQHRHPGIAVRYVVASSQEVFSAIYDEGLPFDLVISSAMDLQMKLANDGFAAPHVPAQVARIPPWARWQDRLYAFAQEDVVLLVSRKALGGLPLPETRRDLIELLRENPVLFRGRIGTYDPALSGAGYLFATQDTRQSDSFWRLAEVMGSLAPRLYVSTNDMIDAVKSGRIALAYNTLGSYAAPRLAGEPDIAIVELQDYTLTLLRTAIIPTAAKMPALGGAFLDFLLSAEGQAAIEEEAGLPPIDEAALAARPYLRPMRLDPGLLVFLDSIKRQDFLDEWRSALTQN
jgi:iron(III) transport system substrate-binding protein